MKITVEKEMTPGALLRELVERRVGALTRDSHDCLDRFTGTCAAISPEAYEAIASDFISAVRMSILREGNQR